MKKLVFGSILSIRGWQKLDEGCGRMKIFGRNHSKYCHI